MQRDQIRQTVDAAPASEVEAAVIGSFAGLGNAAVVERILAHPDAAKLFADAPLSGFGQAASEQKDVTFDNDEDAAEYINAMDPDGSGVTGLWLGQVAHAAWEADGFATCAPGVPFWLDRTIGTICADVDAPGAPSNAALRPDGAALLPDGRVLDAELKPSRIQSTAVPQLADRQASFAAAGVSVAHEHGPWSTGQIGPLPLAFGMTMMYEPGTGDGVVAYYWRRLSERIPEMVPDAQKVVDTVSDGYHAFRGWWVETLDQHPWLWVPLVSAILTSSASLVLLLIASAPFLAPFLAL